jgi:hypothetical protein
MRIAGTVGVSGGIYELLGAAGAAAEGAEEEDGDGAGEEDAGGRLERGGVVVDGEERRGAELHGPLATGLAGTGASVGDLRRGRWRRFRFGANGGGAAKALGGESEWGGGEAVRWGEAEAEETRGAVEQQHRGSGVCGLRPFGSEDNGPEIFGNKKCYRKTE